MKASVLNVCPKKVAFLLTQNSISGKERELLAFGFKALSTIVAFKISNLGKTLPKSVFTSG